MHVEELYISHIKNSVKIIFQATPTALITLGDLSVTSIRNKLLASWPVFYEKRFRSSYLPKSNFASVDRLNMKLKIFFGVPMKHLKSAKDVYI